YEEYYIPGDWISFKKHQLQQRLRNHVDKLFIERGYKIVWGSWDTLLKCIKNPDDNYIIDKYGLRIDRI
ncbi:10228_t:CDS:1, partial [Entrophospora sp. SA101]